jgi:SNF2 family DNA or RNA helicase
VTLSDDLRIAEIEEGECEQELARIEAEEAELDAQILALREQIRTINEKKHRVTEPKWEIQTNLRKTRRRKVEIEQQVRVEEEAERVERELFESLRSFDEVSKDAIWRTGNRFGDKALKHQVDGAYLLASARRAILADSMGVGKTLTSIATLDLIGARKILIICPGEVMSGFAEELGKWTNRPVVIFGRQPKAQIRAMTNVLRLTKQDHVAIINYEAWARDRALLIELESLCYDTVICDEAHRIKETDTAAYKGVEKITMSKNYCHLCDSWHQICPHTGAAERSVKNVFLLTGTPILNRPQEIYSLLHILRPQDFDTKAAFMRNYCEVDSYTGKVGFRPGGMAMLAARLKGMYLRRTRETAGIKLPQQHIQIHAVELDEVSDADQIELLDQLARHAQVEIEAGRSVGFMNQLTLLMRQRQAATWAGGMKIKVPRMDEFGMPVMEPVLDEWEDVIGYEQAFDIYEIPEKYHKSAKMDAAMDLLEELVQDGQRVVVFSQFKEALYELQRRCVANGGINSIEYHGDTPPAIRDEVKRNFDRSNHEESKWDAVLCHYKTGGVGLTLTAATQMIILDEEWNPGMNDQAYGRLDRIGQTEETTVHIFQTVETVDEWMSALNKEKRGLIGEFDTANSKEEKDAIMAKMLTHRRKDS